MRPNHEGIAFAKGNYRERHEVRRRNHKGLLFLGKRPSISKAVRVCLIECGISFFLFHLLAYLFGPHCNT